MANIDVVVTENFEFLEKLPPDKFIAILEGSTRSTKTYSIEQWLIIQKCLKEPGTIVRCFRFDSVTHNKTTIKDFKEIMMIIGAWEDGSWNGTDKEFKFDNGSLFAFEGTSNEQKLHGCKQDIAWLNEVMEIPADAYAQIAFRTSKLIIMDFNPSFNHHWVFSEIMHPDNKDWAYQHSTYKMNEFLSPQQIAAIEKYEPTPENKKRGTADPWKWDVYGLGKRGKIEGAIFNFFAVTDFFPKRSVCQRWGMGLDFGFSLDPTALVECALFQDCLYLREWLYEPGLITTPNAARPNEPSIESHLRELGIDEDVNIYADCAAAESIADLQLSGFNIIKCNKSSAGTKEGSILHGIDLLKQRKIFLYRGSQNLQLEFEHYRWKKGVSGEFTRKPIDKDNHLCDAARYWAMAELQQQKYQTAQKQKNIKVTTTRSLRGQRSRGRR